MTDDRDVPPVLASAAALCWRLIVIGVVLYAAARVVSTLRIVFLPCAVALLLCALLYPVTGRLRRRIPALAATWLTVLASLLALGGIGTFVGLQANAQFPRLAARVQHSTQEIQKWLMTGPLHLRSSQVQAAVDTLVRQVQEQRGRLARAAFTGAAFAVEALAATALTIFVLFFLLKDGPRIWEWFLGAFGRHRERVDRAGRVAWRTLSQYVHGTVMIAAIHAVVIAVTLVILGVPLVAPLAVVVFFGSFIPIVGILVAGLLAVLVVLSFKGVVAALIFVVIIVAEQQLEGHLLQPLVVGRWVHLHPLGIILAIAIGGVVGGIPGAAVAVPVAAVVYRAWPALREPPSR